MEGSSDGEDLPAIGTANQKVTQIQQFIQKH